MNSAPERFPLSLKSFTLGAAILLASVLAVAAAPVRVSEQTIVIPTYLAGDPEPNPIFYFGRGSQGAQGRVYPYPLYDSLTDIKSNKVYRIVYLENEYVRIGILPEIGGRLFEGIDKSNGYNFIYRQHVIKPALIGLIGAWISGGIEWNIPHHHRATTFLPVQYEIEHEPDGSQTVWVGELEVRHRMRWAVGYTLHPGKSYLECRVRILNRTPLVNSMLCFANVAVHVNENYQVIYPPGTRFVTFHGKREFTTWPIATTRYAGADFTRGVDVSWYTNHISANSMFAWNYEDDFFAGYDHGKHAGIMSFANHEIAPGKKFWTWGNGPRGRMWDKILTDDDGPYIELMVGAYSDNQPDYSWLQPYETKSLEMYWYPFREIGGVKKANLEAAVNLEARSNGVVQLGFCTTASHKYAVVTLKSPERTLLEEAIAIDPTRPYLKEVPVPSGLDQHDVCASISVGGRELVSYTPLRLEQADMPEPVKGPPEPKDIQSIEELFLAGLRIEQFHDPNRHPEPYWDEALRRDPEDARVNTAVGIRQLKQARYAEAEQHFRKAIGRLTTNYTSPKDGESFYYLGLALVGRATEAGSHASAANQQLLKEAADALWKATWSQAWRAPAYFALAELASRRGDSVGALDCVERSLRANALNLRALNLKAALLRQAGRRKEALALLDATARETDRLDVRLQAERWLAGDKQVLPELTRNLAEHPATGLEAAAEYADASLWTDGTGLLNKMLETCAAARDPGKQTPGRTPASVTPLAYYYLAWFAEQLGESAKAADYRRQAMQQPPDYVFPFQTELIPILRRAIEANPRDPRAPYYLGNLLCDSQLEQAVQLWEQAAALDPSFAIVHRNLANAYWHQQPTNELERATAELEKAVACPRKYALHFAELDELYALQSQSPEKRLAVLEANQAVVLKGDDALSREIGLKIFAGRCDEAIRLMTGRKFSVWEGGTLEVASQWVDAHLLRGQQKLATRQFEDALADFQAARSIPPNLPAEREIGRQAEIAWCLGQAYEGAGNADQAKQSWQRAAGGAPAGTGRRRSEDSVSERQVELYYQALAQRKLGQASEAEATLKNLIETAERALNKQSEQQAPEPGTSRRQPRRSRTALAHYVAGLGHLGLGETDQARTEFAAALAATPDHLGAQAALRTVSGRKPTSE